MLDGQFRGTPQRFVLHFNELSRRLDDLTDISERMPESLKMALLQNAVKDIPQLSIVETLDEYTSTTCGDGSFSHLNYSSYYNLLINACVRYDATKTSTPVRGEMFMQLLVPRISTPLKNPTKHISFMILTPNQMTFIRYIRPNIAENPPHHYLASRKIIPESLPLLHPKKTYKKYDGPVYVPAEVYKLLSPEAVVALKKYNSEAINKMVKKRGIHVTDVTDHELSIAETNISEEKTNPHQMMMHLKVKLIPF